MKRMFSSILILIISLPLLFYKCSSSEQSYQTKKPVGENIPPWSAVVLCNVNSFTESGDVYLVDVSVKSVLGYGSATDEIAPGTNMKLQTAKRLIEIKSLKKGTELHVEIRQPKMRMENGEKDLWTVSQLIK